MLGELPSQGPASTFGGGGEGHHAAKKKRPQNPAVPELRGKAQVVWGDPGGAFEEAQHTGEGHHDVGVGEPGRRRRPPLAEENPARQGVAPGGTPQ